MTFLRQRETSRISSRGKGPVYNTGGGGGGSSISPSRRIRSISISACQASSPISSSSSSSSVAVGRRAQAAAAGAASQPTAAEEPRRVAALLASGRLGHQAECMIIDGDGPRRAAPPLSRGRPRLSSGGALTLGEQRYGKKEDDDDDYSIGAISPTARRSHGQQQRQALLERRTAKFSSNRHRKLQPFRET